MELKERLQNIFTFKSMLCEIYLWKYCLFFRLVSQIHCPMSFLKFPFDRQTCIIKIQSCELEYEQNFLKNIETPFVVVRYFNVNLDRFSMPGSRNSNS
jgi:hypothetical protein